MFNNKKVNIVISIVVAIVIWAYVVGEVDPSTTKTFSGIEIEFTNSDTLEDEGLAVVDPGKVAVDVTVVGKRADVSRLKAGSITAKVDLKGCGRGNNKIAIDVSVPKTVKVDKSDPDTVTVRVDNLVTEKKTVEPKIKGLAKGKEAGEITALPKEINVTGAESQVAKVDHVRATVKASKIKNGSIDTYVTPVPVDKSGNKVEFVDTVDSRVHVTGTVYDTKTVSLKVEVTGTVDSSVQLSKTTVPDEIEIKGTADRLKDISEVTAESVSLNGIKETTDITLHPDLPEGVEVSEKDKNISMRVVIRDLSSKTIQYAADDVKLTGPDDGLQASIKTASVTAKVKGTQDALASMKNADISLSADLSGLDAGTHKVKLEASYPDGISDVILTPARIEVEISEKE